MKVSKFLVTCKKYTHIGCYSKLSDGLNDFKRTCAKIGT